MARVVEERGGVAENRNACCVAAACMMWRWVDVPGLDDASEAQRRGYCGLAGRLEIGPTVERILAQTAPAEFPYGPDDFANGATYHLAKAVAEWGISPRLLDGGIAVGERAITLMADIFDVTSYPNGMVHLGIAVNTNLLSHLGGNWVTLPSALLGHGNGEDGAIRNAAAVWVGSALQPLCDASAESDRPPPDVSYNHYLPDRSGQELYDVYSGTIDVFGFERKILSPALTAHPYQWLAERETLTYEPAPFHLVKVFACRAPDGQLTCDCTVDGEPFEEANNAMAAFPWPYFDVYQSVRWFSVLRRFAPIREE